MSFSSPVLLGVLRLGRLDPLAEDISLLVGFVWVRRYISLQSSLLFTSIRTIGLACLQHPFTTISPLSLSIIPIGFSLTFSFLYRSWLASSSKEKGKKPMGDEPLVPSTKPSRKGKNQVITEEHPVMEDCNKADADGGEHTKKEKKERAPKVKLEKLKAIQSCIQANISTLNTSSFYATIVGDPVEAKEVRKRIRLEWKFLTGGFQLVPVANKWFELRFDLPSDRELFPVWERRPFHVAGQLLILRPWSLSFDPWSESVTRMDLWVRIPGLPTKFVSEAILKSLIEDNKIGAVIRVAAFSAKGARLRYPRICISTDLALIRARKVTLMNEKGEIEHFPVWFEDFPEGCGSCGLLDHVFEDCPLRKLCNAFAEGILGQEPGSEVGGASAPPPDGGEWARVAARRAPPPTFGHSKADIWSCFGKNVSTSSESSSSNSSAMSDDGKSIHDDEPSEIENEGESLPPITEVPVPKAADNPPDDVHSPPTESIFLDPEMYVTDDDATMDYEEELGFVDGFGGIPADMTQAEFDIMLANIPTSEEFELPVLSNPTRKATTNLSPAVAPPMTATVVQESELQQLEGSSKTESGKRKLGDEDGDSACSKLMGGVSKRGKNGK